eukprot:jgi/Botrbrau1/13669/Bobra.0378s0003.1
MLSTVGATRNRTDLFFRYRNQALAARRPLAFGAATSTLDDRETRRLLEAPESSSAENGNGAGYNAHVALAPQYVEFKEAVRSEMSTIKQKMNELKSLHGRAALTTFDDSNSHESETDEKVKHNVQRTLAIELQKLSVQFRKQQKSYLNKIRQQGAAGSNSSFWALDDERAGQKGLEDYDPGFSDVQMMKADTLDAMATERDREVRNILQSINDLAQIMKDLSVLVIDQGTILDRIDYNMEQVAVKVDEGVKQLLKAEKYQKQSRLIMCIMFLIVAVIFMLFIVIFKTLLF